MNWPMGQSAPSASLQVTQIWKERVVSQGVMLPPRGTWQAGGVGWQESNGVQNREAPSPTLGVSAWAGIGQDEPPGSLPTSATPWFSNLTYDILIYPANQQIIWIAAQRAVACFKGAFCPRQNLSVLVCEGETSKSLKTSFTSRLIVLVLGAKSKSSDTCFLKPFKMVKFSLKLHTTKIRFSLSLNQVGWGSTYVMSC